MSVKKSFLQNLRVPRKITRSVDYLALNSCIVFLHEVGRVERFWQTFSAPPPPPPPNPSPFPASRRKISPSIHTYPLFYSHLHRCPTSSFHPYRSEIHFKAVQSHNVYVLFPNPCSPPSIPSPLCRPAMLQTFPSHISAAFDAHICSFTFFLCLLRKQLLSFSSFDLPESSLKMNSQSDRWRFMLHFLGFNRMNSPITITARRAHVSGDTVVLRSGCRSNFLFAVRSWIDIVRLHKVHNIFTVSLQISSAWNIWQTTLF